MLTESRFNFSTNSPQTYFDKEQYENGRQIVNTKTSEGLSNWTQNSRGSIKALPLRSRIIFWPASVGTFSITNLKIFHLPVTYLFSKTTVRESSWTSLINPCIKQKSYQYYCYYLTLKPCNRYKNYRMMKEHRSRKTSWYKTVPALWALR